LVIPGPPGAQLGGGTPPSVRMHGPASKAPSKPLSIPLSVPPSMPLSTPASGAELAELDLRLASAWAPVPLVSLALDSLEWLLDPDASLDKAPSRRPASLAALEDPPHPVASARASIAVIHLRTPARAHIMRSRPY
jgi:hypothetical protein